MEDDLKEGEKLKWEYWVMLVALGVMGLVSLLRKLGW